MRKRLLPEGEPSVEDIAKVIEAVDEDTCDFDLVAWSCDVHQIVLAHDLFLTRHSARWNSAWSLLDGQLLVVLVDSVNFINHERALLLTYHA